MKVAIFSDVQANLPAMETAVEQILAWDPYLVVMAGDLVNRGPSSACVERFDRERGWLPVQGNHETCILRGIPAKPMRPALAQQFLPPRLDPRHRLLDGLSSQPVTSANGLAGRVVRALDRMAEPSLRRTPREWVSRSHRRKQAPVSTCRMGHSA